MVVRTSAAKGGQRKSKKDWERFFFGSLLLLFGALIGALLITVSKGTSKERYNVTTNKNLVAEYETVEVPVPVERIPVGVKGDEIPLRFVRLPASQLRENTVRNPSELGDLVTTSPLPGGLPLLRQSFERRKSASNPVIEQIPSGMRAMTVKVDATSAVEGWAGSGSVVDVLLIEPTKTTVIAERVRILSAERSVVPIEREGSPNVPSTVTLLVTQEQCLSINTAIPQGRIAFALRNVTDDSDWRSRSLSVENGSTQERTNPKKNDAAVSGYISFTDGGEVRGFALSEGRWVKSEVIPQGFLVGRQ